MKEIADWIRGWTPGLTDEGRYKVVATLHSWLPPICLLLFTFTENIFVRFFTLWLIIVTLISEFALRDCVVTMVEKEFSDSNWDDLFETLFREMGWEISRSEKMTFNIGLNSGLLIMIVLMLLRQSVLWIVGFASLWIMTSLPSLVLLSKAHRPLEIVVPM